MKCWLQLPSDKLASYCVRAHHSRKIMPSTVSPLSKFLIDALNKRKYGNLFWKDKEQRTFELTCINKHNSNWKCREEEIFKDWQKSRANDDKNAKGSFLAAIKNKKSNHIKLLMEKTECGVKHNIFQFKETFKVKKQKNHMDPVRCNIPNAEHKVSDVLMQPNASNTEISSSPEGHWKENFQDISFYSGDDDEEAKTACSSVQEPMNMNLGSDEFCQNNSLPDENSMDLSNESINNLIMTNLRCDLEDYFKNSNDSADRFPVLSPMIKELPPEEISGRELPQIEGELFPEKTIFTDNQSMLDDIQNIDDVIDINNQYTGVDDEEIKAGCSSIQEPMNINLESDEFCSNNPLLVESLMNLPESDFNLIMKKLQDLGNSFRNFNVSGSIELEVSSDSISSVVEIENRYYLQTLQPITIRNSQPNQLIPNLTVLTNVNL